MKAEKDKMIETLRGAVIILVVIGHVIGSASDGGMKVGDDSFLRYFYYTFIDPIQMPLFTIIAGWVYALRPVIYEKINDFILKKALRILVPMLVVGICYFLLQYFTPGTNSKGNLLEIWKLLIFPYTLYWYLYSLFLVFIIIALIDSFDKMKTLNHWLIIFSISVFILPSFILGVGLNRFKEFFHGGLVKYSIPVILLLCVLIQQLSWFKVIDYTVHKDTIVGLLIGLLSTIMLLRFHLKINWLIWIGGFAYSIYLFHAFGTAGGRIILKRFDVHSSVLIFTVSLAVGILLPIAAEKILERFKITRLLFLGKS